MTKVSSEAVQAEPLARRAGNAGEPVAGEAVQAEPAARKKRTYPSERGEKTADGRPKPDERTVADLVRRGWCKSEAEAVALLTRGKTNLHRYPFETAERAADWLEATLGAEPVKDGLCPAAKAVKGEPLLLARDAAALQCKWDALMLPSADGGVGIAFSTEQAREAVSKHPRLLGHSVEKYKAGWSMLTVTEAKGGLGLSLEKARECILRGPEVLRFDHSTFVSRVKLLESLGYAEALSTVLAEPRVLNYQEETVKEHAAWWKQTGLDHVKLVTAMPTLLGGVSVEELQAKLDFLRRVAGMSIEELNKSGPLLAYSLDNRLRARYFYALLKGPVYRCSMSTLMLEADPSYVAYALGRANGRNKPASKDEVARYREEVASPEFVAWRERQEAGALSNA